MSNINFKEIIPKASLVLIKEYIQELHEINFYVHKEQRRSIEEILDKIEKLACKGIECLEAPTLKDE